MLEFELLGGGQIGREGERGGARQEQERVFMVNRMGELLNDKIDPMDVQQGGFEVVGLACRHRDVEQASVSVAFTGDVGVLLLDGLHHVAGQVGGVPEREGQA